MNHKKRGERRNKKNGAYQMVKGVNKQIIEVINTENDCFERALLFVKPEKQSLTDREKLKEADRYVKKLVKEQQTGKRPSLGKRKFPRAAAGVLKLTGAAAAGAVIASIVIK